MKKRFAIILLLLITIIFCMPLVTYGASNQATGNSTVEVGTQPSNDQATFWKAMRAHESIARSMKEIAEMFQVQTRAAVLAKENREK